MYKIASIEKVVSVVDHPKGDTLALVKVLGWQIVAKRGQYKAGDLVVYIEPDSEVEERPIYEFLRSRNFRVKLIRLRGEISQGILFPISAFTWEKPIDESMVGHSVACEVGARHYEKPVPGAASGIIKGPFPNFLVKTDEPNLRSYNGVIEELSGHECYITQKLDGTSAIWKLTRQLDLEAKLKAYGKNVAIQGELYGPGIQANRMAIPALEIALFNLYLIDERRFAGFDELQKFCSDYSLSMPPLLWRGIFQFTIEELVKMASDSLYPSRTPAEGIVIRPVVSSYSAVLESRLSVKIVSERFLEEYGE